MAYEDFFSETFYDDENNNDDVLEEEEDHVSSIFKYVCNNCNANFCSSTNQNVKSCIVCCKDDIVFSSFFDGGESFVLPFKKTKNDFIRVYRKKVFWNPLVPLVFKQKKIIQTVNEVNLASFLSDVNQKGLIHFVGGEKEKGQGTKKYDVLQSVFFDYKSVSLNITSKIEDKVFQTICDYDFGDLKSNDFNNGVDSFYLLGDLATDTISEKAREKIAKQTISIARQNVPHPLKRFKDDQSMISFENTKMVFLPVFLLTVKYKNKVYQCIMNGQNGRFYFDVPIGIIEMISCAFLIFGIFFLISYLVARFL